MQEGIRNPRAKPQRKTRLPKMRFKETRETSQRDRLSCNQRELAIQPIKLRKPRNLRSIPMRSRLHVRKLNHESMHSTAPLLDNKPPLACDAATTNSRLPWMQLGFTKHQPRPKRKKQKPKTTSSRRRTSYPPILLGNHRQRCQTRTLVPNAPQTKSQFRRRISRRLHVRYR